MEVLDSQQLLDFMEIIEDRHGQKATIIMSQLPIVNWYDVMKGNTIAADAILDRLVHTSVCFEPQCESMRQKRHSGNSVKGKFPILVYPLFDGRQQAPVKKRVHKFNDYYLHIVMGRRFS